MRQALSFDIGQITSVTDFVKRFLLDDIPIEIETFQARYATWREMQKQIARVESEIKVVEAIRSLSERVMDDQFNARLWSYGEHRAEYDRYGDVISRQRQEIAKMQEELESLQAYQATLADNIEFTRLRLSALKQQIDGTPAYKQIEQAQAEKDHQDAIRRAGNTEAKPIFDALRALRDAALSDVFPERTFPAVADFARHTLSAAVIGD